MSAPAAHGFMNPVARHEVIFPGGRSGLAWSASTALAQNESVANPMPSGAGAPVTPLSYGASDFANA
jgi:hypothetical protein